MMKMIWEIWCNYLCKIQRSDNLLLLHYYMIVCISFLLLQRLWIMTTLTLSSLRLVVSHCYRCCWLLMPLLLLARRVICTDTFSNSSVVRWMGRNMGWRRSIWEIEGVIWLLFMVQLSFVALYKEGGDNLWRLLIKSKYLNTLSNECMGMINAGTCCSRMLSIFRVSGSTVSSIVQWSL